MKFSELALDEEFRIVFTGKDGKTMSPPLRKKTPQLAVLVSDNKSKWMVPEIAEVTK